MWCIFWLRQHVEELRRLNFIFFRMLANQLRKVSRAFSATAAHADKYHPRTQSKFVHDLAGKVLIHIF
jgi:hypothetical protein